MKDILVTDTLFINDVHEAILKDAGYAVHRINKPKPSNEELVSAIKGKSGYILGGIEEVNEEIIDAADQLEAISFCGIGYQTFIPAHQYATQRGIAITNTPGGPTYATAEWAVTLALAMTRNIFDLGRTGDKEFLTTPGIENQRIGIIGYGRIGTQIGEMMKVFHPKSISYFSSNRHRDKETSLGISYQPLNELLETSDIIFVCVPREGNENLLDKDRLAKISNGSLVVSFTHPGVINEDDLFKELSAGRIRAASDYPMKGADFKNLPLSTWFCFNGSNAFNTENETKLVGDMVVESMLNVFTKGTDQYLVNPQYVQYKK
jgi:D-3-phosphoglycerate dehydrogenase